MVTTPVLGADLHEGDTVLALDGPHTIDHFRPYPGRFVGDTARQAFDVDEQWRCTAADHELFHVQPGREDHPVMKNPLARLADELHHARIVHRNHDRITELQEKFDTEPTAVNRAVLAMQIADRQASQADHLTASWLARAVTALPGPDVLREDAARWDARSGELFAEAAKAADR